MSQSNFSISFDLPISPVFEAVKEVVFEAESSLGEGVVRGPAEPGHEDDGEEHDDGAEGHRAHLALVLAVDLAEGDRRRNLQEGVAT